MSEHEAETIPESELVELFRRRRPDASAFRARVAARVAEREREPETPGPDESSFLRAEFVRRAAALLPLDPNAGLGLTKVVGTSLALPWIVLCASVGSLLAAGRSVLRSSGSARPAAGEPRPLRDVARSPDRSLAAGRRLAGLLQTAGMLALLLPSLTGSAWAVDLVVLLVLASAGALVLVVRGLAQSALLTPRTVSTYATSILGAFFAGAFLWPLQRRAAEAGSDLGLGWSAAVVFAGIAACALLAGRRPGWSNAFWILFLPFLVVLNPFGLTRSSPASLRQQLAAYALDAREIKGWEQFGLVAEALTACDERLPPLPTAERELDDALARGPGPEGRPWTAGVDPHPRVWNAAAQAGLMTAERWRALAAHPDEQRKLDRLLESRGPLLAPDYDEYQIHMLVATRAPTREQREALAQRIDAAWPAPDSYDPLSKALVLVRCLDQLDLPERADAHRADVMALLVSHGWTGRSIGVFRPTGGFTPDPETFQTSMPGTTHAAVVLMTRFGVPAEIDLRRVRAYLRAESAAFWLLLPEPAHLKAIQRAALLRLEQGIGIPPRAWIAALVGERILIACLLLVGLCVLAIRSAPRPGRAGAGQVLP